MRRIASVSASPYASPVSSTIVASATAPGESALAIVRCSGPACRGIAERLLAGRAVVPRAARLVTCRSADTGAVLDRGLLTFFEAPASFTGEDMLELSLHGNPFIVARVIEELLHAGCVAAQPGEFTKRAFLNGKLDLSQAEAVAEVIRARSDAALAQAQRQLAGELGMRVRRLVADTIRVAAELEAYLDFPEEDLPDQNREAFVCSLGQVREEAAALASTRRLGAWVRDGIRVVLVGEPNAGKSSLLNRLVGSERALVDPKPGTTRDFIEAELMVAGFRVVIVDTAGLRETEDAVERAGVERTRQQAMQADLLWFVVDAAAPGVAVPLPCPSQDTVPQRYPSETWLILNKSDLLRGHRSEVSLAMECGERIELSAATGAGISDLLSMLEHWILARGARDRAEGLAVSARHADALDAVVVALDAAVDHLKRGCAPDVLLASEVRAALEGLGSIVGRIDHEEVLDVLFSTFCIGK